MNTDTGSSAFARPPSGGGPRVHRAKKNHVKNPKKVLVIDDNPVILKTTAFKLKGFGYEVVTAEDGASAIAQVRQIKPHLILLDLNFPPDVGHGGGVPWDGLLILSWLRRMNEAREIPVIVITGGDLKQYQDRCSEAGVLDIFLKPIDHDALVATIRWALNEEVAAQDHAPAPLDPPAAVEPAARRKILLVDDESDWRYMGALYLTECGYEVVTVEDPVGALVQAPTLGPDLILLDLNLGGESGVTLLQLLAAAHPEVPILIYTGLELDDAEVQKLLSQGASNFLRKGSMAELLAAVGEAISGSKGAPTPILPSSAGGPARRAAAEESLCAVESALAPMPQETNAAPDPVGGPKGLVGLRKGTPEALLAAVGRAKHATPERTEPAPALDGGLPDEANDSEVESVLIVDQDAEFADTLRTFLESHSFHVAGIASGPDALSQISSTVIDLIIFDLTLPSLPVEKFYRAVEAVKPHLCQRIIFMSSDDSHAAADGFVRRLKGISLWKPFPLDRLLGAVQTIRGRTRQDHVTTN